jgi:hypothetical protein
MKDGETEYTDWKVLTDLDFTSGWNYYHLEDSLLETFISKVKFSHPEC